MRRLWLAAIVPVALSATAAQAERFQPEDWYGRMQSFVRSLTGRHVADHEIIKPPGDIDRKMVLSPPEPQARMRIIPPPDSRR